MRFCQTALLLALIACGDGSGAKPAQATANSFSEAAWHAPTEADIPTDAMGASIKRGLYLLRFTPESLPGIATSS